VSTSQDGKGSSQTQNQMSRFKTIYAQ